MVSCPTGREKALTLGQHSLSTRSLGLLNFATCSEVGFPAPHLNATGTHSPVPYRITLHATRVESDLTGRSVEYSPHCHPWSGIEYSDSISRGVSPCLCTVAGRCMHVLTSAGTRFLAASLDRGRGARGFGDRTTRRRGGRAGRGGGGVRGRWVLKLGLVPWAFLVACGAVPA